MTMFIIAGLITALGVLIILLKLSLRFALYWEVALDVLFTIAIPLLFAGTYSGLMTAVFAGIFISLGLRIIRVLSGNSQTPDMIAHIKSTLAGKFSLPSFMEVS